MPLNDTESLVSAIADSAYAIEDTGKPLLKPFYERCLEEHLAELEEDVIGADRLRLIFSRSLSDNSGNYDMLIDAMSLLRNDESISLEIEKSKLQSVIAQPREMGRGSFDPILWLKVKTGQEKPVLVIKDGKVFEDDSQGRWYGFPIRMLHITTFTKRS